MSAFDFLQVASQRPDAPALFTPRGTTSYRALSKVVREGMALLEQRPEGPEAPMALLALPEVGQIALALSAMALGAPLVPVHPRLTPPERAELLHHAGVEGLFEADWRGAVKQHGLSSRGVPEDDERVMAMLQTSGTAGRPKLACLPRRAFAASARASAERLGWRDDDAWLLALPFAHIGGLSVLTRCLAAARPIALARGSDDKGLALAISEQPTTLLSLVPTQLGRLLALENFMLPDRVRAILVGGAACLPSLMDRALARGWPVLPTYGLTEACSQICTVSPNEELATGDSGRPLPGTDVSVRDGRIRVRGPTLFTGYLSPADRSLQSALDPSGWFYTGDMGYMTEQGRLVVSGREDDVIITGGENVHPEEVEAAVAELLPALRFCVFGLPDSEWGHAVALAIEGPRVEPASLRGLRVRLAAHKLPKYAIFVPSLPRGPSGKLRRSELRRSANGDRIRLVY
jgi:O-succinylbenzoic acid--CoA ligase